MGYVEVYNVDGEGGWTDINDIPFIETVNCQLCNEPTEARDIMAIIRPKNKFNVGDRVTDGNCDFIIDDVLFADYDHARVFNYKVDDGVHIPELGLTLVSKADTPSTLLPFSLNENKRVKLDDCPKDCNAHTYETKGKARSVGHGSAKAREALAEVAKFKGEK